MSFQIKISTICGFMVVHSRLYINITKKAYYYSEDSVFPAAKREVTYYLPKSKPPNLTHNLLRQDWIQEVVLVPSDRKE